jgi:hypothetical protein
VQIVIGRDALARDTYLSDDRCAVAEGHAATVGGG